MRIIVHLDADAFFASVEQAANTSLRGKPVAVGGERRGIIASASYEARKFGVYTPMPTARARKLCPKLIVLPGDFERYEQFSHWMFGYCYDFTPDVEQTSIDEGYFDLSANRRKSPDEIALTIRKAIRQSLKISVSEGIAANKLVSQIASKLNKPAAFQHVPSGGEKNFLHPLSNRWLPGIGPKTATRLNAAGLAEIRHIAATPPELLELLTGSQARQLQLFANGIDDRPLIPAREPQKSFSQQETFAEDQTDEEYLEAMLRRMADRLFAKVREDGHSVRTLTVKVRYNDMAEDQCSESLREPTDLETDVYGRLALMLKQAWKRRVSLRLVSLKLANVYSGVFRTELALDRDAAQHEARERLARVVDELRRVKGTTVLLRGHDFVLKDEGRMKNAEVNQTATSHRHPAFCILPSALSFVPLRVHSYYSFLDSTLAPREIVALAARYDCPTVALTDAGNLHGAVEFALAAKQASIKPVFGAELRVGQNPLLLYVQNARGYTNLCRLLSQTNIGREKLATFSLTPALSRWERENHSRPLMWSSNGERPSDFGVKKSRCRPSSLPQREGEGERDFSSVANFHRRSFNRETLARFADGLIAVSSDTSLASLFPNRFYQLAGSTGVAASRQSAAYFGSEASDGGALPRRRYEPFPAVACPAIRYATPQDRQRYDIVQSIRTRTLLRQAHPEKRLDGQFHFRMPTEMALGCKDHPDWLAHAREIAERCEFALPFDKPQFPAFRTPDGSTSREFLRQRVLEGLRRRYHGRRIVSDTGADVPLATVQAQIETELAIIADVGYEDLFLITWDLLQECRARGIEWITRGSAADSLVCYCLGISDVCPIRFGLYFRRFLNKERMALHKLPDIDVDFPHDRKDDVVDLLFAKYGPELCAVVGGFSTFQARSAVGDVAKVLGVSEHQIRRFTEHFPWSFGGSWMSADAAPMRGAELIRRLKESPECRDLPLDEEPFKTAVETAAFLDGFPRHPKMHPCGVVLSRQPMHELTPTFISNKGWPTTHFDMDAVEAIGLVKMDILAQGGLAVMRDAKTALAARGVEVDLQTCTVKQVTSGVRLCAEHQPQQRDDTARAPLASLNPQSAPSSPVRACDLQFDDPEIWEMISRGGARAVHHIESPAMTSLCRMCNVREIDGLIAIVSVIRPGAANEQKKLKFTRRYQGMEPPEYPHLSLEACLRSTFGLVVYEEHILQICEAFAGLSPGRADVLRRALVKQKWETVQKFGREFVAAARARGHRPEKITEVWELVTSFNGYAFCKAHSTAYGVEAYQAAWLKRYFPAEFMAGVLTNGKGFYDPLVYVLECHRLGLKLLPPSVNQPGPEFKAGGRMQNGEIRTATALELPSAFCVQPSAFIRVPATRAKGLTERTVERWLAERQRGEFASLADFYRRVSPQPEELEILIRLGTFDEFGASRTAQFWEAQLLRKAECRMQNAEFDFGETTKSVSSFFLQPSAFLCEPTRRERLEAENDLLGFPVSGHPLELYDNVAWDTYCPVARLGEHVGEEVVTCGLIVEQRTHHQITGEPMKFLTLADWTGMVETELFAATYKSHGLATVRYPVLEVTARVEPFENGRGYSLRVLRAGKPRTASP